MSLEAINTTEELTSYIESVVQNLKPQKAALLLTIDEAAEALSISRSSVYRLVTDGDLKSLHMRNTQRRSHRIPMAEIERYIEDNTK